MAKEYIKELGDKLSPNASSTDGTHVKTIAPVYYMTSDESVSGDTNVKSIQGSFTELDQKIPYKLQSGYTNTSPIQVSNNAFCEFSNNSLNSLNIIVNLSTEDEVPNTIIQVDNLSFDKNLAVSVIVRIPGQDDRQLGCAVSSGNVLGAGKLGQVTVMGNSWTLAEIGFSSSGIPESSKTVESHSTFVEASTLLTAEEISQGYRDILIPLPLVCFSDHSRITFTLTKLTVSNASSVGDAQGLGILPELYMGRPSAPTRYLIRKIPSSLNSDIDDSGRTIAEAVADTNGGGCPVWNFEHNGRQPSTACHNLVLRLRLDTTVKTFTTISSIKVEGAVWETLPSDRVLANPYPQDGEYGLAIFGEPDPPFSDSTEQRTETGAVEFAGNREWLLDWRPYLVDMSPVPGEIRKTPVAELKKNNWLRKIDGSYAPVVGITSAQATALNGTSNTLYWKSGSAGDKVSATVSAAFDASGNFVPSAFWEYVKNNLSTVNTNAGVTYNYPIEVKVYVGDQAYEFGAYTAYHIPAPWETTETKYSVFIGRDTDCYLVDGYSETTGEYMRGLTSKPVTVGSNEFDPEEFKLSRTGIAPGPCTTKDDKVRSFFYNYAGTDTNTNGSVGTVSSSTFFYNNGTYPRTGDASQYTTADWSRGCNATGTAGAAYPVGEGGYHALNAFLCSIEAGYGTRNLFSTTMFSSGVSSNDTASAANGGLLVDSTYYKWVENSHGLGNYNRASQTINNYYSKFQCLEPQIAASLAVEMGVPGNSGFHWNGGTWHWESPTAISGYTINGLMSGEMNCRIYKLTDALTIRSKLVQCNLRCALVQGVNPVGDIWWHMGGGAELVYLTDGTGSTNYKYFFYLEPDQTKWVATNTSEKITSGKFDFESSYKNIIGGTDGSTVGGTGDSSPGNRTDYCLTRTGYSPVRRSSGDVDTTGECCCQYRQISDDAKGSSGIRSRRRFAFRGNAHLGCSPRFLYATYRPSNEDVAIGCSAQVLLA